MAPQIKDDTKVLKGMCLCGLDGLIFPGSWGGACVQKMSTECSFLQIVDSLTQCLHWNKAAH